MYSIAGFVRFSRSLCLGDRLDLFIYYTDVFHSPGVFIFYWYLPVYSISLVPFDTVFTGVFYSLVLFCIGIYWCIL